MGGIVSGIGNAISDGINAVEDLGKGDIGGAISSGLGAVTNGIMATNPELGMVSSIGSLLGGLTGMGGSASPGAAGGSPGLFGGLSNILGGVLQNPLGSLGGLLGGGNAGGLMGSLGSAIQGATTAGQSGGDPLQQVKDSQGALQQQQVEAMQMQLQNAMFQNVMNLLGSLINDDKQQVSQIAQHI